jgi:putative addiction module component
MELTINIKDQKDIASFLNLIRKFDYVEIVDIKENSSDLPLEHKRLLDERLKKVENGKTSFKNWDLVKRKYEGKTI